MVKHVGIENMPAAEVHIDEPLVRALLADQHPDLAAGELTLVANGWDNVLWRLGPDLVVRLPRRQGAADLVLHEQRWLPGLARGLPLPVPVPVHVGRPGAGFPWSWSICAWVAGERASSVTLADPQAEAVRLGSFLRALHVPAPPDAPANPYRGRPLADRSEPTQQRLAALADVIDRPALTAAWEAALAVEAYAGPPLWLHGDLHPANILAGDGRIVAVIDFGDITAGDPATDLAVAWMLLPAAAGSAFRSAAGTSDDATWRRARGWALSLALAYIASSADNPAMAAIGHHTLHQVLADPT